MLIILLVPFFGIFKIYFYFNVQEGVFCFLVFTPLFFDLYLIVSILPSSPLRHNFSSLSFPIFCPLFFHLLVSLHLCSHFSCFLSNLLLILLPPPLPPPLPIDSHLVPLPPSFFSQQSPAVLQSPLLLLIKLREIGCPRPNNP